MNSFDLKPEIESEINYFSFGCVVDNKCFVNHFRSQSNQSIYYSMVLFRNYRKKLSIQLKTFFEKTTDGSKQSFEWVDRSYEFLLNYSQIKSIHLKDKQMFLCLTFPPLLYAIDNNYYFDDYDDEGQQLPEYCDQNDVDSGVEDSLFDSDCEDFIDIVDNSDSESSKDNRFEQKKQFYGYRLRTTKLMDINEQVFTKTNTIRLDFKDVDNLADILSNIRVFEPLITIDGNIFETIESKPLTLDSNQVFGLPFGIEYSLQSLTNHSFLLIDCLDYFNQTFGQFVNSVKELTKIDEKSVENSLNDLRVMIENNMKIKPLDDLKNSFEKYRNKSSEKWTNSSVISVRRVILTPTRFLPLPALPLQVSRFLRVSDPEYVIRVMIKDEDFQQLSFTIGKTAFPTGHPLAQKNRKFLNKVIVKRLANGIVIGGRHYQLIGASTSQLRDHGLVLYASDDRLRTAINIRQEIGKLDGFRNAAKFIARIGQSMSQSMGFIKNVDCVQLIDDIEGGCHPVSQKHYCFSDGVGMISPEMANELCDALHIRKASTFQIRYAGFKGIVVLNPELTGRQILMRPSMKKFESDSTDLDVLKVSEPRSCYLNRPLIAILNHMDVSNEQFLELLFIRHKQLMNAFECECKAIRLMSDYSGYDFHFKQLLDSGIDILKEPVFVDIIQSIIKKVSLDLKNKARILIPFDSGRVMYGVLDETQSLNYGQVFVQFTDKETNRKHVLTQEILVTKYPCMHAGDVRKLQAVDIPALHHIVDCIVFPAVGHRPHPDEMAGSDLDGDEYSVIWYQPMIFDEQNSHPMDFPFGTSEDLGRLVTNEDILEFYCRFILNNQVGLIATSHLVLSDFYGDGIKSSPCLRLAYKYAVALDYAKTGINEYLMKSEKPKLYPDFMMKSSEKPTVRSNKALGKLFQKNCLFHDFIQDFTEDDSGFQMNPKLIDKRAEHYMENARHMFELYDNSVKELMDRFGIESESSLISSTFNKTNKYLCTHNDNNDIYDLVTNIIKRLFSDLLKQFESDVTEEEELLAKASAWYQISHQISGGKSGFPWIVTKYLSILAKKNGSTGHECQKNLQLMKTEIRITKNCVSKVLRLLLKNTIGYSKDSIDEKIATVFDKYHSKDTIEEKSFPATIFIELLSELSDNIKNFDEEYDLALNALMAKMLIRRMGLIETINYKKSDQNNNRYCVSIVAITDRVANFIRNSETNQQLLMERTNLKQLAIKYRTDRQPSYVCVYGSEKAVNNFRKIFSEVSFEYIESELKNILRK